MYPGLCDSVTFGTFGIEGRAGIDGALHHPHGNELTAALELEGL